MMKNNFICIVISLFFCVNLLAQGGVSTGEAKIYTTKRTVGVFDAKAPKIFEDVTAQTTLKNFVNISGDKDKNQIIDAPTGSIALFDYDNDGKVDIYLLNGSTIEALQGKGKAGKSALYRNLGNWKFEDVTDKAGVANERWGTGVAVGDYDNDGDADLFVSNFGVPRFYQNNGNGTFTDVAEKLGITKNSWHTGASFGDYDKDGRLDLFVPAYVEFDINKLPPSPADVGKGDAVGRNFCQFRGQPVMCGPRGLTGAKDTLYRQKSDGTFEDVSEKTKVNDEPRYYGFSSVWVDVDSDNDVDLLVVNDSTPKQLYINNGDGTFEESGYPSGIALNENGREQAGMGLAVGDYDNDSLVDFHITNFSDDSNVLYRNDGEANFTDVTFQAGLGETTIPFLGWGTSFLDYDNDGWKDIIVGNGHVYPLVDKFQWGTSYAQQMLLFKNGSKGRFDKIGANPNSALAKAIPARGLAVGDLDDDGKLDVIVNCLDSPPFIAKNADENKNHWLTLKLIGNGKTTPKDAIGSTVYVTSNKIKQRFDVMSGAGFTSQNDQRIHVGLGNALKIDKLEIQWANGKLETFDISAIDKVLTIEQDKGVK